MRHFKAWLVGVAVYTGLTAAFVVPLGRWLGDAAAIPASFAALTVGVVVAVKAFKRFGRRQAV